MTSSAATFISGSTQRPRGLPSSPWEEWSRQTDSQTVREVRSWRDGMRYLDAHHQDNQKGKGRWKSVSLPSPHEVLGMFQGNCISIWTGSNEFSSRKTGKDITDEETPFTTTESQARDGRRTKQCEVTKKTTLPLRGLACHSHGG